jgi:uncharacterized protein
MARKMLMLLMLISVQLNSLYALDVPPTPNRLVNDYAGMLQGTESSELEKKLLAYNDSTSTQIAVVILESLEGDDLFEFSQRLAEAWGIGGKENDNGVLLLVALEERQIRIHTGYGTEGALPDAISKRIIEQVIKPAFKSGNYYLGLDQATDAMMAALQGEYTATDEREGDPLKRYMPFILLFIILIIAARRKSSTDYSRRGRGYYGGPWIGGGFGGFGGGSGSGFGGGGGGFGGFGGGGFGGGGASGSW